MKRITVAVTKKTAACVLTGSLLLTTGCATAPDGGVGDPITGFGRFLKDISQPIPGEAGKIVRSTGGAVYNTGTTIARQEQREKRAQEAERRRQEAEERQRQMAEQRRLQAEQERRAFEAMTPEQKAEYRERKRRSDEAGLRLFLGVWDILSSGNGSSGDQDGYGCYERGTCACQNDPKCLQVWEMEHR